jgi:hypothetical protein
MRADPNVHNVGGSERPSIRNVAIPAALTSILFGALTFSPKSPVVVVEGESASAPTPATPARGQFLHLLTAQLKNQGPIDPDLDEVLDRLYDELFKKSPK